MRSITEKIPRGLIVSEVVVGKAHILFDYILIFVDALLQNPTESLAFPRLDCVLRLASNLAY